MIEGVDYVVLDYGHFRIKEYPFVFEGEDKLTTSKLEVAFWLVLSAGIAIAIWLTLYAVTA